MNRDKLEELRVHAAACKELLQSPAFNDVWQAFIAEKKTLAFDTQPEEQQERENVYLMVKGAENFLFFLQSTINYYNAEAAKLERAQSQRQEEEIDE